ncbi:leukemia inhibitory factor receptor isoform X2 [Scophthalmus maximus]|uniref:leukemia inhibitory factor receptor isoform X2 n=1 Tax=Scophthalmus maximus TaxID=52904 RepID=UPI001FA934DF|nr:leukemia inhibitory factor receptor isoform X2 [Scophthalmus maximus]
MVGRGFQFDFLDLRCSSCAGHSHLFILGLMFAYCTTLSSHVQASKDGVHDLQCFGKYSHLTKMCVWRPGNHSSEKTYTLIIQQNKRPCKTYNNIKEFLKEIKVFENDNIIAEVFENGESTNCTKAVFSALPRSLCKSTKINFFVFIHLFLMIWTCIILLYISVRCDPPHNVSFSRRSRTLDVHVSWLPEDEKAVKYFSVRYKALGSLLWIQPPVKSQNGERCAVENLNSSLFYTLQIQCVTNDKCSQCPWSERYTVPPELTAQPVIVKLEDTDIAEKKGSRLLSLNWKFPATVPHDGYYVTIGKASGEAPCEQMRTAQPEIRLVLSHSAYHLNISAVNSASTSPPVGQTIPQRQDAPAGKLNVTVHSNTSFTVYWKDDVIKTYVCYSVEWRQKGHKAASMSFYQNANNWRTLSPLPAPLEPYKRYSISLHTRPEKETCNIKYINGSESTYGSTQFYFVEGSPVSAPSISSYNVTLNSVVLQWSSIPEEDVRGFLLGYMIHYAEYHHRGTSTERNITVDPRFDTYELWDLKGGAMYQVQISGITQAGAGVRSAACIFITNNQGYIDPNLSGLIVIFAVVIFGSVIIKRAKVFLWPSIPNPGNSNAMQKIEGPWEMELLSKSIKTLTVEEWDTDSLRIVEKEGVVLPSVLLLLHDSKDEEDEEDEEDSSEAICNWTLDTEHAGGHVVPDDTTDAVSDFQSSPVAFSSEYTTLESFQQLMPQGNPAITQDLGSDPPDTTVVKLRLDYVKRFSASPTLGSEEEYTGF